VINKEALERGLEAKQPCRMEQIPHEKYTIFLDVGHNINAVVSL